jgi:hypothetical protein
MSFRPSRRQVVLGMFTSLFAFLKPRPAASAGTQPGKTKGPRESVSKPYDGQGGETFVWGETCSDSYDGPLLEGPGALTTVTAYDGLGREIRCQSVPKRPWL